MPSVNPANPAKHTPSADAARLGEPSYSWRSGQERRLDLIRAYVPLEGAWILDVGCGIGTYVRRFRDLTPHAFGVDVSAERLAEAKLPGLAAAKGEHLPFRDGSFDVLVFNEVIEHVEDDRRTLEDAMRVLRPGGHVVIYAPNRLYPFETHGIYLRGRYHFGNVPFVNWLPRALRNRLVPHARVYGAGDWPRVFEGSGLEVVTRGYVYPGFDNVVARWPLVGTTLRAACYWAESTWFARFGLSHLVVLRGPEARPGAAS